MRERWQHCAGSERGPRGDAQRTLVKLLLAVVLQRLWHMLAHLAVQQLVGSCPRLALLSCCLAPPLPTRAELRELAASTGVLASVVQLMLLLLLLLPSS